MKKLTAKEVEKIIKKDGWFLVSVVGSHHQYKHSSKSGKVTIAFHSKPKDLKPHEIKSILKQAGIVL